METAGTEVATALKKGLQVHEEDNKEFQKTVVEKAEIVIQTGLQMCTNDEQRVEIQKLEEELTKLKAVLSEASTIERMKILKTVLIGDPSIRSSDGRGHLHRCPNGHYYIIADCGQPNQQSRCPDCGAAVGGGSHRFAGEHLAARDEDLAILNRL